MVQFKQHNNLLKLNNQCNNKLNNQCNNKLNNLSYNKKLHKNKLKNLNLLFQLTTQLTQYKLANHFTRSHKLTV